MICNANDEINFLRKLSLTKRQVANLRKTFVNNASFNIKLSKTESSKIIQSDGFHGRLLASLLKSGLSLMKNVIQPSAKSVLIPLGLTAATLAPGAVIHKKIIGSRTTTLIIANDEMEDIMKIVKSRELLVYY